MTDAPVKLRHLWAACCDIWPDMPSRDSRGRSTGPEFDKRAAFCLAAKPFGFSSSQIGNFIKREHATVLSAQKQAMERRSRDSDYGVAINRIRALARVMAAREERRAIPDEPAPFHTPEGDPDAKINEFATRFDTMMENGSRALLKALITRQAHVFAETLQKSSSCPTKSLPSYYFAESQGSNLGA